MLDMGKLTITEKDFIDRYKAGEFEGKVLKPWQDDLVDLLNGKVERRTRQRVASTATQRFTKEEVEDIYSNGGCIFMGEVLMPGML